MPGCFEGHGDVLLDILEYSYHADGRRGIYGGFRPFVVEADIAAHHRHIEGAAGIRNAFHRTFQLPEAVRLFRFAEIQAVGDRRGIGADADQVARGFRHRDLRAEIGIKVAIAAVAVGGDAQTFARPLNANNRGIARARRQHGIRLHHMVVLFECPALAGDIRRREQLEQARL